jgi:hypothetical protein
VLLCICLGESIGHWKEGLIGRVEILALPRNGKQGILNLGDQLEDIIRLLLSNAHPEKLATCRPWCPESALENHKMRAREFIPQALWVLTN